MNYRDTIKLNAQIVRNAIKSPKASRLIYEWFFGKDAEEGELRILYSHETNEVVTTCVWIAGQLYFLRCFFVGEEWNISLDECVPVRWLLNENIGDK